MYEVHSINAKHNDLIHDVAYDYYGQRMATCSSDQHVKIWDQDKFGNWNQSSSWKAHSGSVWKVTWCHPEFGQVIATCSFDRTACVWEEIVVQTSGSGEGPTKRWIKRANLVDSRTSVTDVRFAPKYLGLYLTTCSSDGIIRIYEAPDVMNLSQWTQQHEVSCKFSCSCITWTNSFNRFHIPLIAAGSDESNSSSGTKVVLFEYNDQIRRLNKADVNINVFDAVHDITFAPTLGRSFHLLAIATKNVKIIKLKPIIDTSSGSSTSSSGSNSCTNTTTCLTTTIPTITTINSGISAITINTIPGAGSTTNLATSLTSNSIPFTASPVTVTASTAVTSTTTISPTNSSIATTPTISAPAIPVGKYDITVVATFEDHYCTVWRVCWNVLGTILASSGDDGCVRLWKSYKDTWKCVNVLKGDGVISPVEMPATISTNGASSSQMSISTQPATKARFVKLGTISHPNQTGDPKVTPPKVT